MKKAKASKRKVTKISVDLSFRDFIVADQLSSVAIDCRKMFGAFGLYHNGKFFGIIHGNCLFFKTSESTRQKYIAAGMPFFQPTKTQAIRSYYQVPEDIFEDRQQLLEWAREAWSLEPSG